jgi:ketosteroid isomerase-like protein
MHRLTLPVLSLALLAGCQTGVAPLTDEDIAALNALRDTRVEALIAGDMDAAVAVFTEDALAWRPDAPAIEGRAAIRADSETPPGVTVRGLTLTSLEIDGYGDLAFDRGTWEWTLAFEGTDEPVVVTGKYVVIARKQEDGTWLWTLDMSNTDAPMPGPEQP